MSDYPRDSFAEASVAKAVLLELALALDDSELSSAPLVASCAAAACGGFAEAESGAEPAVESASAAAAGADAVEAGEAAFAEAAEALLACGVPSSALFPMVLPLFATAQVPHCGATLSVLFLLACTVKENEPEVSCSV